MDVTVQDWLAYCRANGLDSVQKAIEQCRLGHLGPVKLLCQAILDNLPLEDGQEDE